MWKGYNRCSSLRMKKTGKFDGKIKKFPDKKYQLIYCDPAWKYWSGGLRNASRHYFCMDPNDIKNLPVNQIAEKNSVLCMWATYPNLPLALEVMKAWGFEYSTVLFTWVKRNKNKNTWFWGCGNYTRANAEIVLLGKKGKGVKRKSAKVHQIIETSRLANQYFESELHSKKPDIVRSRIIELFGDVSRIELFARTKLPEFGDVWGNDEKLENLPLEVFS